MHTQEQEEIAQILQATTLQTILVSPFSKHWGVDGIRTSAFCCFILLEHGRVRLTQSLDRLSGDFMLGGP